MKKIIELSHPTHELMAIHKRLNQQLNDEHPKYPTDIKIRMRAIEDEIDRRIENIFN